MPREASVAVGRTTAGGARLPESHLLIDNTHPEPDEGAERAVVHSGLRPAAVTPVPLVTPGARDSRTRARGIRGVRMLA
ncbi:hypothetical protein GCM10023235_71290 [Kitasatospora terrestris]|uniref:Uncharacterized protein n=1 Tax=Kitasatospora terrestris TaxID=258051 RepID=A0ABP9EJE4_9ACTN